MVNDVLPLLQKTLEMEPPNSEKLQIIKFELNFLRDLFKMYLYLTRFNIYLYYIAYIDLFEV